MAAADSKRTMAKYRPDTSENAANWSHAMWATKSSRPSVTEHFTLLQHCVMTAGHTTLHVKKGDILFSVLNWRC